MKSIDIKLLKLASVLQETESLTLTGKKLHLSQPAISHQLKALEDLVGTKVFERQGKRMVANPAGRYLADRGREILLNLDDVMTTTKRMVHGEGTPLKVAVECYTCYNWLPYIIREYHKDFPSVDVQIVPHATVSVQQQIIDGTVDLGIVANKYDNDELQYASMFSDDVVLLVNKNSHLSGRASITLDETIDEHWLLYSGTKEKYVENFFLAYRYKTPRKITELQLTEAIIEWVNAGLGITMLAAWAARPYLSSRPNIETIPVSTQALSCREWYAACRYENAPDSWQAFVETIKQYPPTNTDYTKLLS